MKVKQTEKEFRPVELILESQKEVDAIFAVLNHVDLADALETGNAERELEFYKSDGYESYHERICALMK